VSTKVKQAKIIQKKQRKLDWGGERGVRKSSKQKRHVKTTGKRSWVDGRRDLGKRTLNSSAEKGEKASEGREGDATPPKKRGGSGSFNTHENK